MSKMEYDEQDVKDGVRFYPSHEAAARADQAFTVGVAEREGLTCTLQPDNTYQCIGAKGTATIDKEGNWDATNKNGERNTGSIAILLGWYLRDGDVDGE